jgi:outer membrane protein OmpU
MKKIMYTTTVLISLAGAGSAEVLTTGDAAMGVVYDGDELNYSSSIHVKFTMAGQTDGGLGFGAWFEADKAGSSDEDAGASKGTEGNVFLVGAFGKIEMGGVPGAAKALFGNLPEVGYTDLDDVGFGNLEGMPPGANEIPYLTGAPGGTVEMVTTGPKILYTGVFGPISVAGSASDGVYDEDSSEAVAQEAALAAAYAYKNLTIGASYEYIDGASGSDKSQVDIVGIAAFGATSIKAYYADGGKLNTLSRAYGLGLTSVFGPTKVAAYVNHVDTITDGESGTMYGIGATYNLGGGASIIGGIADSDIEDVGQQADLGLRFSF